MRFVEEVSGSDSDDPDFKCLAAVKSKENSRLTALIQINGYNVRFQLDGGADVNIICKKFVKKCQIKGRVNVNWGQLATISLLPDTCSDLTAVYGKVYINR